MNLRAAARKLTRFLLRFVIIFSLMIAVFVALGKYELHRLHSQQPEVASAHADRIDDARVLADLRWLSDPAREGRAAGTPGSAAARAWLEQQFADIGLESAGSEGYLQPFLYAGGDGELPGVNVIGRLAGSEPDLPMIAVTAHYDHEGIKDGVVYPGADDNASGTAAMLAAARYFRENTPRHTLLFIAFDAEETGLNGSRAFVAAPTVPLSSIGFNLNLDMVARTDHDEIVAVGTWQHPWLRPVLDDVQKESTVAILFGRDRPLWLAGANLNWVNLSDQAAFHDAGIPFLFFSVEDHADYHQPTDTFERIDPVRYAANVEMIVATLMQLDARFDAFVQEQVTP